MPADAASSRRASSAFCPAASSGILARRAEKQFRKDFERLKRLLER